MKNRGIKRIIKKRIEINNSKKVDKVVPNPDRYSNTKKKKYIGEKIEKKNSNIIKQPKVTNISKVESKPIKKENSNVKEDVKLKKKNITIVNDKKNKKLIKNYFLKDYGRYCRAENVDYDAVIIISSFNRFEYLDYLLNEINFQKTKYSYKIILINDGSTDHRYEILKNKYCNVEYIKNKKNGGKINYWKTFNLLLEKLKLIKFHVAIQIDDDFTICKNFLNNLIDTFFEKKEVDNSYMLFKYHLGLLDKKKIENESFFNPEVRFQDVDGGTLFDRKFLELIDFKIENPEVWQRKHGGSGVWNFFNKKVVDLGVLVYTFNNSLVYHKGFNDSVMHPNVRKKRNYNTINYVDYNK